MKSWIRSSSILVLTSSLLIGCQTDKAIETKPKIEVKKEFGTTELISKVKEKEQKDSFTYQEIMKGEFHLAGKKVNVEQVSRVEETSNPQARHLVGTSKIMGKENKEESYEKDGWSYEYDNEKKAWTKSQVDTLGANSNSMGDPLELLKFMDKEGMTFKQEGISLKHEGNSYKINIDTSKAKNNSLLKQAINKEFADKMIDKSDPMLNGVHLNDFNMNVLIDDQSFNPISTEGTIELSNENKAKPISMKFFFKQDQFAPFNGNISVPEDVVLKSKTIKDNKKEVY